MKIYKIGRYFYKEISEKEYCKLFDENSKNIATLIDYDGEAIKYFKQALKQNG